MAGYPEVTIIEEPQAAFYAWIDRNPNWRERVKPGDLVFVVDIGGGTTDLTLISIIERDGELQLERIAVGEHLLLGGDNMDLALARYAGERFAERGTKLDAIQFHALWQQCRAAKEALLASDNGPEEHPLTILGRSTGVIGKTVRSKLHRDGVRSLLLEGFFPVVGPDAAPQRQRRAALMEVGLTLPRTLPSRATSPRSLRQAAGNAGASGFARPTHLLLNGGVLLAGAIEHRLFEVLNTWLREAGAPQLMSLQNDSKHVDLTSRSHARSNLLRLGAHRKRYAFTAECLALTCRHRNIAARRSRIPSTSEGTRRGAIRRWRERSTSRTAPTQIRSCSWRTGRLPFLSSLTHKRRPGNSARGSF